MATKSRGKKRGSASRAGTRTKRSRAAAAARRASDLFRNLHDSQQKMRAILHTAVDGIITIDHRGIIESVNPAAERLFGYTQDELVGRRVNMLMPAPYQQEHDSYLRNYLRTGKARIIGIGREVSGLRKDGTIFPLNLAVSEVQVEGRRLFTGIVHDLTERRQLEKQVLEAATNEQRRIGQDIHDGLCQELVGLGFEAELLASRLAARSLPLAGDARKLGASIRKLAGQARQLAHGLNPVDVKAGGLAGALAKLAARISESFGITCVLHSDGSEVHDDAAATHLYRIAQEAISNALRHGKATRVELRLETRENRLTLKIIDNGAGFPAAAPPEGHGVGIGLQTMQHRARIIDATFDILSPARGGSTVVCSLRNERTQTPRSD